MVRCQRLERFRIVQSLLAITIGARTKYSGPRIISQQTLILKQGLPADKLSPKMRLT